MSSVCANRLHNSIAEKTPLDCFRCIAMLAIFKAKHVHYQVVKLISIAATCRNARLLKEHDRVQEARNE